MSRTIREAFLEQGRACDRLGSPFMARLMPLVGTRLDAGTAVGARCLSWRGEPGPAGDSLPLRLAGALHGLMLDGSEPSLAAVYPPAEATDDALWQAVDGALRHHEARIMAWLERAPQTNEVRRTAAVIAGIWWTLWMRCGFSPICGTTSPSVWPARAPPWRWSPRPRMRATRHPGSRRGWRLQGQECCM